MQDETALYGAKMMQPGLTVADNEENKMCIRDRAGSAALVGHRVKLDAGKKTERMELYTAPKAYNLSLIHIS